MACLVPVPVPAKAPCPRCRPFSGADPPRRHLVLRRRDAGYLEQERQAADHHPVQTGALQPHGGELRLRAVPLQRHAAGRHSLRLQVRGTSTGMHPHLGALGCTLTVGHGALELGCTLHLGAGGTGAGRDQGTLAWGRTWGPMLHPSQSSPPCALPPHTPAGPVQLRDPQTSVPHGTAQAGGAGTAPLEPSPAHSSPPATARTAPMTPTWAPAG